MRGTKRVYSDAALEAWLPKLETDWEPHFSDSELKEGRRLYQEGAVRELELSAEDAIIHTKITGDSIYAVVDWDNGRPHVRASIEDDRIGRCLAAAGMYEIEELVADEVSPLPQEMKSLAALAEPSQPADPGLDREAGPQPETKPDRPLVLVLRAQTNRLVCTPMWDLHEGGRKPAFGSRAEDGKSLTVGERESLIRFTTFARRAGWAYEGQRGIYTLDNWGAAPGFLQNTWPRWSERFEVDIDADIRRIREGIREADLDMDLREGDGETMSFVLDARVQDSRIEAGDLRRLVQAGAEQPVWVKGHGLLQLAKGQSRSLSIWQEVAGHDFQGNVPRYMIFSLFADDGVKVQMNDLLMSWQSEFYQAPAQLSNEYSILRDYQTRGIRWLAHILDRRCHALLADEMGLGKTLQVLSLLNARPIADSQSLIVCPASVVPVWEEEIRRHFPEMHVEVLRTGHDFDSFKKPSLWLASYTQLRRHKHLLDKTQFGYTVLDESHYIKNPEAKVTQACLSLKSKHRLALTGTPLENRQRDLWTLFRYLMPGLLGSLRRFEDELARHPQTFNSRLRKQIAPFVLRRTKGDVLTELPEKVEMDIVCPMTDRQRREYQKLLSDAQKPVDDQVDNSRRVMNLLALLTRLRQASCDPALLPQVECDFEHSGKINVLLDRLQELHAAGSKVVIFSQFVKFLERIKKALRERIPELPRYELTGATKNRSQAVQGFQQREGSAVFLISLKAGGTGLNLQNAEYVFLLDPWWNPSVEAQAIDRVHRMGQRNRVFVYRLIAQNSIEQRVQQLKDSKSQLFEELTGELDDSSQKSVYLSHLEELMSLLD